MKTWSNVVYPSEINSLLWRISIQYNPLLNSPIFSQLPPLLKNWTSVQSNSSYFFASFKHIQQWLVCTIIFFTSKLFGFFRHLGMFFSSHFHIAQTLSGLTEILTVFLGKWKNNLCISSIKNTSKITVFCFFVVLSCDFWGWAGVFFSIFVFFYFV